MNVCTRLNVEYFWVLEFTNLWLRSGEYDGVLLIRAEKLLDPRKHGILELFGLIVVGDEVRARKLGLAAHECYQNGGWRLH